MSTIYWYHPDTEFKLERATDGSSGYDLKALFSRGSFELAVGARHPFRLGLRLAMPLGCEAQVRSRSGLFRDHGVWCPGVGTIDSDYRGEIGVTLINHGERPYTVVNGERVCQLVFAPVLHPTDDDTPSVKLDDWALGLRRVASIESLGGTKRGEGGFGSTGR